MNSLKPVLAEATLKMWLIKIIWLFNKVSSEHSVLSASVYLFPNHWLSQSLCPCAFFSWLLPSFASLFSSASFPECNLSQPFFFILPSFCTLLFEATYLASALSALLFLYVLGMWLLRLSSRIFRVLGFTVVSSWTASGSSYPFSWWFSLNLHPLCLFLPNPHFFSSVAFYSVTLSLITSCSLSLISSFLSFL